MVPLDVAPSDLVETIRVLARSESVAGFNLTMPHNRPRSNSATRSGLPRPSKVWSIPSGSTRAAGWSVTFFDGGGFLNAAREAGVFDPGRRCVVIGAGGAGARDLPCIVAAGLKRLGILNETPGPVEALAAEAPRQVSQA